MFPKINLDRVTIIYLYIILLCGMFKNIVILGILIIVHELGHALMGYIFKWKINAINIYPYGGNTVFQNTNNKPIYQELLVLIMGPLFQVIASILLCQLLRKNDISIMMRYNYALLAFNLLPLYPLDGGKLLLLILELFKPFYRSLCSVIFISLVFSFICFFIFIFYNKISIAIMFFLVILKDFKYFKNRYLIYNNFLLDRYLNKYSFKKRKVIFNKFDFYKDYYHTIKYNYFFITENSYLKHVFSSKIS